MGGGRDRQTAPSRYVAGGTVLSLLAAVFLLIHYSAYLAGPGTHDLTDAQRVAAIRSALKAGSVPALRESGMTELTAADIGRIGASRCTGEQVCLRMVSSRGRGPERCGEVRADLFCAYEIVDRKGEPAAAMVRTYRGGPDLPDLDKGSADWLFETFPTDRLEPGAARKRLCEMGYCAPGALARFRPAPAPTPPPDPNAEARSRCAGVLAEIVGKGLTCLDPTSPETREFRDCKDGFCGPLMVALPRGTYRRGTSEGEIAALRAVFPAFTGLGKDEAPEREVAIGSSIAVGKFEITLAEWDECAGDRVCKGPPAAEDEGFGRGRQPAINVSWQEIASQYLPWLNRRLGLSGAGAYRLLTDAEWEYAARGGAATRYAFGDMISTSDARYFDGRPGERPSPPAEAGSFPPNRFGLHDMHGNVAEWVEDCFSFMSSVEDLPTDGSAATRPTFPSSGSCDSRAHRGGSYLSPASSLRAAARAFAPAHERSRSIGFRVARTLDAAR